MINRLAMKPVRSVAGMACMMSAAVTAMAQQGELDLLEPVQQAHHLPIADPPSTVWPSIPTSASTSCDHPPFLFPFPVDDAWANPPVDWIERFWWTGTNQFPSQAHPSVCFHRPLIAGDSTAITTWQGVVGNLDPMIGADAPTLPPLYNDPVRGTSPLVPAGADAGYSSMFSIAERELIAGSVDAATGGAVLRHIDLELPFGGATFRHVRTYADPISLTGGGLEHGSTFLADKSSTRLWDWHGLGWMVGHNPILLIDAALPGLTSIVEDDSSNKFFERRCYFMPDAHHAIPFDLRDADTTTPVYEAPPRFGARLQYNGGSWDPTLFDGLGGWSDLPESFTVWLYNGAVKYTIVPIYEDVIPLPFASGLSHQRHGDSIPSDEQGAGVPYLGLTVRIEDRYGNTIVNEYCSFQQYDCEIDRDASTPPGTLQTDKSGTPPGSWPTLGSDTGASGDSPPGHQVCCQTCHRKGQLHRTLLYPAGATEPQWTLVYRHRAFAAHELWMHGLSVEQERYPYLNQTAINTVRVYRGAKAAMNCVTMDFRAFHPEDTLIEDFEGYLDVPDTLPTWGADHPLHWDDGEYTWIGGVSVAPDYDGAEHRRAIMGRLQLIHDLREPELATDTAGAGPDWVHELQYTYTDSSDLYRENMEVFAAGFTGNLTGTSISGPLTQRLITPRLILAVTTSKNEDGDDPLVDAGETLRIHAYRYAVHNTMIYGSHMDFPANDRAVMSAVFEPKTIESVTDAIIKADNASWPWTSSLEVAQMLAIDDYDAPLPAPGNLGLTTHGGTGIAIIPLREAATRYFARWFGDDPDADHHHPSGPSGKPYFLPGLRRVDEWRSSPGDERSFGTLLDDSVATAEPLSSFMASDFLGEMISMIGASETPIDDILFVSGDVSVVTAPSSGTMQPTYKIYRFMHMPETHPMGAWAGRYLTTPQWKCRIAQTTEGDAAPFEEENFLPDRALWHFPHRIFNEGRHGSQFENAPVMAKLGEVGHGLNRPLWYVVVDEYSNQQRALVPAVPKVVDPPSGQTVDSGYRDHPKLETPATGEWATRRPSGRRIVALNAMGFKVWDRTYKVTPTGIELTGGDGFRVAHVHDDQGRIVMTKSYGWSAAELVDPPIDDDSGLVTVFDYDYGSQSVLSESTEPRRIGVQWGDGGDALRDADKVQWIREFYRDPDRPEVILAEVAFDYEQPYDGIPVFDEVTASSGPLDLTDPKYKNLANAVFHEVAFNSTATFEKAITHRASARSAAPSMPGGPAQFAIEAEVFDAVGQTIVTGRGVVADVELPGDAPGDIFFIDWTHYDSEGRPLIRVQDATPGPYSSYFTDGSSSIATGTCTLPTGWMVRRPQVWSSSITSAEKKTSYLYGKYGLRRVNYPNGDQKLVRHQTLADGELETITYEGAVVLPIPPEDLQVKSAIPQFRSGTASVERVVRAGRQIVTNEQLGRSDGLAINPQAPEELAVISKVTPDYDASGRPATIDLEAGGEHLSVDQAYNQFGTVDRTKSLDGTITRNIHDELGRQLRSYRGTNDWSYEFGAPPGTPPTGDDMVLTELRAYGTEIRNATLLTDTWTFRDHPPMAGKYAQDPSTLEPFGTQVRLGHDWRMREVARMPMDRISGQAESLEVTYMDAMGRPRFQALFDGSVAGSNTDPNDVLDSASVPGDFEPGTSFVPPAHLTDASAFLSPLNPHLRRLTETLYNARGNVSEVREYDLSAPGVGAYTTSSSFYDHNDEILWAQSPGGGSTRTVYDAFGREVYRAVFAGDVELSRVDTSYDANDNATVITMYDRIDGATGPALNDGNAVVTQTHHWYRGGKLICTAELGTGPDDVATFDAYATPTTRNSVWDNRDSAPPLSFDPQSGAFSSLSSSYQNALVSAFVYDEAGNQEYVVHPDRTVTRSRHDSWGNVTLVQEGIAIEDSTGEMSSVRRATFYEYLEGKVQKVGTLVSSAASHDPYTDAAFTPLDGYQITEVVYGADVVTPNSSAVWPYFDLPISTNNEWISTIRFPGDEVGVGPASFTFTYYVDGSLATRTDARGVEFAHFYDDQGRRIETRVTYGDEGTSLPLPTPFDGGDVRPADRVSRVAFSYDQATGELLTATSYTIDEGTGAEVEVAQSVFEYDENGRLIKEHQERGGQVVLTGPGEISPFVGYTWQVDHPTTSPSGSDPSGTGRTGFARLTEMTYPVRYDSGPLSDALMLEFDYGSPGEASYVLDRIIEINEKKAGSATTLASFLHSGAGMRVRRATHDSAGTEIATEGFRAAEDSSLTVTGYEHFDRFGRSKDHHWRSGTGTTQYRSLHTFDERGNRLGLEVTRIDNVTGIPQSNARSWAFKFDSLQRLVSADTGVLSYPSMADPEVVAPLTGHAWVMDELGNWTGDGTDPGMSITGVGAKTITHTLGDFNEIDTKTEDSSTTSFVYDRAGNLVYDGFYWYRYDAWNRLIQIVKDDPGSPFVFNANGVMTTGVGPGFGDVVAVFAYDALGRLVGRQAPYPGTTDEWRTETYLYDGSRRIAERWKDPIVGNNGGGNNGWQQNQQTSYVHKTNREYVYTPGYVDEFVVEIDEGLTAWPILQDANYNAVAMTDHAGVVVRQRVLSPYGRVMLADHPSGSMLPPKSRIGHQGLFAERLDADTLADPMGAGGSIAWHNRNRTLLSEIGRFAQRDPNTVGQGTSSGTTQGGAKASSATLALDLLNHLGDGMNVYAYQRSRPSQHQDPSGLFVLGFLVPGPSDFITGALSSMTEQYAMNQMWDLEWALDWDAGDDWHTRGNNDWVTTSWMRGIYDSFEIGIPFTDISTNPLDRFSGVTGVRQFRRQLQAHPTNKYMVMKRFDMANYSKAMKRAKSAVGGHSWPRSADGHWGSPQWGNGLDQRNPNSYGLRLDPPHVRQSGTPESNSWHINYWDNRTGISGVIEIEELRWVDRNRWYE